MNNPRFTLEFKEEAVKQITKRGYSVKEVSERLGVSTHSLYIWVRASKQADEPTGDLAATMLENQKLKAELRRVQEERDILKKAAVYSMGQRNTYPKDEQTGGNNGPDGKTWPIGLGKKRIVAKMARRGITQ